MARYKQYDYNQKRLIAVSFEDQIIPGTFEYALDYLIDNDVDLSIFEKRYSNDETGAPAYDPAILLKIVLYAYSRGVISSRKIERLCQSHILFIALSAESRPHFTTIANFVSSCENEIISVFRDILFVCDQEGLIGKDMFAIDGVKLPSNASKQWSGKRKDFKKKLSKLEAAIGEIVQKHRQMDLSQSESGIYQSEQKRLERLRKNYNKIKSWLDENDDKISLAGNVVQSNITDNDSAKMDTSHGVIQGYDGVAAVDSKQQVIVGAEAFGEAQENHLLEPMIENVSENFNAIDKKKEDIFKDAKLTADAGFHSEANMQKLFEEQIDGYVADTQLRKRDARFKDQDCYKEKSRKQRVKRSGKTKLFSVQDFVFDDKKRYCLCPAGKRLYRNGGNVVIGGYRAIKFRGAKTNCRVCHLRVKCLKHPDRTEVRQVAYFIGRDQKAKESFTQKMKRKIDSELGRFIYGQRLGTVEPVFANICSTKGMNRFTLRGKPKVNGQWILYCMVHNIEKICRYAPSFA